MGIEDDGHKWKIEGPTYGINSKRKFFSVYPKRVYVIKYKCQMSVMRENPRQLPPQSQCPKFYVYVMSMSMSMSVYVYV